MRKQPKLYVC